MTEPARAGSRLRSSGRAIRDGWLVAGVVLLILFVVDVTYRAQGAFKLSRRNVDQVAPWLSPRHPEAGQPWWRQVTAVNIYGSNIRYDPYRGFWPTPMSSPVINVDSAGRRVTPSPPAPDSAPNVLFLGGSVMWGWIVRDSFTIPALSAARFAELGSPVRVLNLAQPTYQISQEATTLLLELRTGRVPDVVVFLDGVNEIAAAYETGQAGHIQNEAQFARRFANGRDMGPIDHLVQAGQSLAIVKRLAQLRTPPPARGPHPELCPQVARQYVAMTRAIEALGRDFHFRPVFLWQPMLATTKKRLGPFESSVGTAVPGWHDMAVRCTAVADSLMAERRGTAFYDLHGVFDAESTDIFWDEHGHVTEAGNRIIANRIVEIVRALPR